MTSPTTRKLLIGSMIIALGITSFVIYRHLLKSRLLDQDIFLIPDQDTGLLTKQKPADIIKPILAQISPKKKYAPITIDYPFDKSVFPPEIVPPTFRWHDAEKASNLWLIDIAFNDNPNHIYVLTSGKQIEPQIDSDAVSSTNENYQPGDYDRAAKTWLSDETIWKIIKQNSVENFATLTVTGLSNSDELKVLSKSTLQLMTSKDPVGAPIFYRDVPLMPSETKEGVIKPIANNALPLISWRLRDISESTASALLKDMPTCANCHTFSRDGKVLGMDMDGPGGDKGAYGLTDVEKDIVITYDDIITWNSYKFTPRGHKNFGLFSQVSPDGLYVISTLNETTFVANYSDFRFLQSFYPTRGILVIYSRTTSEMQALPGADDTDYVHTNACWSPDGKYLVFSRAKAKNNYECSALPIHVGDPNETFIQYDLYKIPFNEGKGGVATPLEGASENGMSNSFPRYSPDGKWVVFVQTDKGQLMRPDSKLYLIPAEGGKARKMNCNLSLMNSWHSWSPNSRWLVFSSKGFSPFTQMFLTHIDDQGNDTPAILIPNSTAANRAVNIPEFLNNSTDAIETISTPTQESYRYFNNANELAKAEKYTEALDKLEKSLQLHPYYAKAYHDKGYILFKRGQNNAAIECLRKAIEIEPDYAMAYNTLGFMLQSQGMIDQAVKHYNQALEIKPDLTNAHINLGNIFKSQDKLDQAVYHYRTALEIKPYLTEAHSNLGATLQALGKLDEAIRCYHKALEYEEDYVPAHYNLGLAFHSQKKYDEAVACFQKALELQNDYVPAHYSFAVTLQLQGQVNQAIYHYRTALQFDPEHANAHYGLGVTLVMAGQLNEAANHFQKSLQFHPGNTDAHYRLGHIFRQLGKLDLAVKHYTEVLQAQPENLQARIDIANVLIVLKQIQPALEHFRLVLQVHPDHVGVLNDLAWILATNEDANIAHPAQAIEFAQKASELTNNQVPQVLDTLAVAYAADGKFTQAEETAEKAIQLARSSGMNDLVEKIQKRLELYKNNQPFKVLPR